MKAAAADDASDGNASASEFRSTASSRAIARVSSSKPTGLHAKVARAGAGRRARTLRHKLPASPVPSHNNSKVGDHPVATVNRAATASVAANPSRRAAMRPRRKLDGRTSILAIGLEYSGT